MTRRRDEGPLDPEGATRLETLIEQEGPSSETPSAADEALELGDFRIVRELGSGGMGRVFLARQLQPVERDVALKVVRKRVLNRRTLVRFEVERQVLAQMQHPAIAQVHDAGTTPQGYPWFAMEYVDGEPLDRYCARERLPLEQRLDLFVRICQGVQHAHQRGIIHRDLKPANILVTTIDGVAQPKIIDFGIATASRPDEDSTTARDYAGTPEYMSPELFADGDGIVDTRSDVYSLGVILYELLIDQPPIDRQHFRRSGRMEFASLPDGGTVSAPSTRLSLAAGDRDQVAARRLTRYRRLRKHLRGDLDAIVLKALAVDREQRYATPAELAGDIARFRSCRPVRARDWTSGYRMGKFMRRHALALGSASAVLLALLAGLTAATMGMIEAQRQYRIAEQRSIELEQVAAFQQSMLEEIDPTLMGLGIMELLRGQVDAGLERAGTGGAAGDFEIYLAHVNATDLAREVVDEQILQRALVSIERDFEGQPLLQADLFLAVFQVYRAVGQVHVLPELGQRIVELRRSELPDDHIDVLTARRQLARGWFATADYDLAVAELEAVTAELDADDPEQLDLLVRARDDLSMVWVDRGDYDQARTLSADNLDLAALAWDEESPDRLNIIGTRGYVLARSGDIEQALGYFQRQLEGHRQRQDDDEGPAARVMINVSAALGALGRLEESLEVNREAVRLLRRSQGERHPDTLRAMANLANTLHRTGQSAQAIELLEDAVALRSDVMGPVHPLTLRAKLNLASVYTAEGNQERALELIETVAKQRALQLGDAHLDTLMARELEANVHLNLGDADTALTLIKPVYTARSEQLGEDHAQTQDAGWIYGQALRELGDPVSAEPLLEATLALTHERAGPEHPATLRKALEYYRVLLDLDQTDDAQAVRERYLAPLDKDSEEEVDERLRGLYREFGGG
jgi:eukaryotic-like serine/threonine-protein kinase